MKHTKHYWILLGILTVPILSNCSGNKKVNEQTEVIQVESLPVATVNSDRLIQAGNIVQFQNTTNDFPEGIPMIYEINDHGIFVGSDQGYGPKVWVFDNEGKFLNSVGTKGKGPGEYLSLQDAIVEKDEVKLLVRAKDMSINSYALNGGFISEKDLELPAAVCSFAEDDRTDDYYFYAGNNPAAPGRLLEYNMQTNKIVHAYLPTSQGGMPSTENTFYKNAQKEIYFWEALGNSVYRINKDGLHEVYHLAWGEDKPLIRLNRELFGKKMMQEKVYLIRNVIVQNGTAIISMVQSNPGNPPELINIIKNDGKTYAMKISPNPYFEISNPEFLDEDNMMYFMVIPKNLTFKENEQYKDLTGDSFLVKIDLKEFLGLSSKS